MFTHPLRTFHGLLFLPIVFSILFLINGRIRDNSPPVAVDDTYTIHASAIPLNPDLTANDSDPDGDPISISSFPQLPSHGDLSRGSGNTVSYQPKYDYRGADSFTYEVCDNQGGCAVASVSLNIVNQPPNGVSDSHQIHGTGELGPFLANDSDPDGDTVTYGDVAHEGTLTFPQHGVMSSLTQPDKKGYSANYGYTGADSFTYNACDGLGLCTPTTVNINVADQPPTGGADSYTVHGATVVGPFLVNDSDPDGDPVSIGDVAHEGLATFPQHGTLSGVQQPDQKVYTPNAGYTGSDSFTYNVCDGLGLCTETGVNINVVNNPPIAGDDKYTIHGTTTIGPLRINDSDSDGDQLIAPSMVSPASHGTVNGLGDPDFKSYVPNTGYFGSDSFTYQVCDTLGACSTATVRLTVVDNDRAENCGTGMCNSAVGKPVNVTNGNMYLQQGDYSLPGLGPAINVQHYGTTQRSFRQGVVDCL
jgi:Bacterial Ig domain